MALRAGFGLQLAAWFWLCKWSDVLALDLLSNGSDLALKCGAQMWHDGAGNGLVVNGGKTLALISCRN